MKKLLILQNTEETPPGSTLEWCESRGVKAVILKTWQTHDWPDLSAFIGLVICGGGMNVDQEDLYPWLRAEKAYIKSALESGVKTLGLCLGAQLMAEVLGAHVGPHTHWEVGWHEVKLEPSENFPPQPNPLRVFQWHRYTFEVPPGARLLGSSLSCANQAFSYQDHGLAFQFHPESTKEWIRECANDLEDYPQGRFVQSPQEILKPLQQQQPELQCWYWWVLDHFWQIDSIPT